MLKKFSKKKFSGSQVPPEVIVMTMPVDSEVIVVTILVVRKLPVTLTLTLDHGIMYTHMSILYEGRVLYGTDIYS